jgi:hypothetical protein
MMTVSNDALGLCQQKTKNWIGFAVTLPPSVVKFAGEHKIKLTDNPHITVVYGNDVKDWGLYRVDDIDGGYQIQ